MDRLSAALEYAHILYICNNLSVSFNQTENSAILKNFWTNPGAYMFFVWPSSCADSNTLVSYTWSLGLILIFMISIFRFNCVFNFCNHSLNAVSCPCKIMHICMTFCDMKYCWTLALHTKLLIKIDFCITSGMQYYGRCSMTDF